jgi:chitinase
MKERLSDPKRWGEFSPDKICIGLASYGFSYTGVKPGQKCTKLRKDAKARYFSYTELPALLANGWTESYDTEAEAPYYFSPDKKDFVTIDNNRSHSRKMEWVFEQKYRGVFWWEFHYDYYPPVAGKSKAIHPLMDHVSNIIEKYTNSLKK